LIEAEEIPRTFGGFIRPSAAVRERRRFARKLAPPIASYARHPPQAKADHALPVPVAESSAS
jgi:hypothetical protein